jgi:hypothetical protein
MQVIDLSTSISSLFYSNDGGGIYSCIFNSDQTGLFIGGIRSSEATLSFLGSSSIEWNFKLTSSNSYINRLHVMNIGAHDYVVATIQTESSIYYYKVVVFKIE